MLYWLTFIQSLPTIPLSEIPTSQLEPKQYQAKNVSPTVAQIPVQPTIAQINTGLVLPGIVVTVIFLLLASLYAYTRIYVVTPNNEAFVRTGGLFIKKKSVILYGGCIVLPGFHQLTRVPLREISIDVERTGKMAVRTKDYLRADIRVTFYVCINSSEEDVLKAAARLSQNGSVISSDDIKNALEKRADDAIRAAAKTKEIAEIDSDKLGFAQEVLNLVEPDLKKVGLTLNNIAISEILESATYDPDSFFDAQGVRLRTEIIQRSIQQKREVELSSQVDIEQKELDAQKRSLQIAQEQESAKLAQKLEVEAMKARREREIQEARDTEAAAIQRSRILQEKSVEEEEIRKKLSLQQSQIEADIALEERNKHLKVSQALQQQEAEIAEISRKHKVEAGKLKAEMEIVESEKLARIAQEDLEIAISAKKRESFLAQAEQAQAQEAVRTAGDIEKAERDKRLSTISAEREAEQRSISDRNVVEIDAFRRRRQAEIAQQAAELEAESIRILAAANRDKVLAEAEALKVKIAAENTMSNANLSAKMLTTMWPGVANKLPEILTALAPQAGVLGDTRIYSFPGANGSNGSQDINKLMLSTSGLSLINTLLEDGKLGELIGQVSQLVRGDNPVITDTDSNFALAKKATSNNSQNNSEVG